MMKLKGIFGKVNKSEIGVCYLLDSPENARDLAWFLDRYPLRMSEADAGKLRTGAEAHKANEVRVQGILDGSIKLTPSLAMALPPRAYQQQAADLVATTGRLLLGDDLGLGKTISAIAAIATAGKLPALVVTLTHLPTQWLRELNRFLPSVRVHILKKTTYYDFEADVIICNYHKLNAWAEHLKDRVKFVVFDEAQELRRATSNGQVTRKWAAADKIAEFCDFRLHLTATPIYNYGGEIFNLVSVLDKNVLGSEHEFHREWCIGSGDKASIKDPVALGTHLRDAGIMLRRTRKEVGRELPGLSIFPHEIEADKKVLDECRDDVVALARRMMDEENLVRGDKFHAAGQFDYKLRRATGLAKAGYVAEFVKMLVESGESVVLYGWHHDCFRKGTPVLMYDGTTKAIEDVCVGDYVMGPDSLPRNVLSLSRDYGKMFEVTPTKGEPFVCSWNHKLSLYYNSCQKKYSRVVTKTAQEFYEMSSRTQRDHLLYRSDTVEFAPSNEPTAEPWLLGYWLGDGCSYLNDLRICTSDHEVVDECKLIAKKYALQLKQYQVSGRENCHFYSFSSGHASTSLGRNPLLNLFKRLGLKKNKHIPLAYKTAPASVRRELLAGLIDADGSVHSGKNAAGSAYFCNASLSLCEDVAFVCRSLGLAAYIHEAHYSGTGYASQASEFYNVWISGDLTQIPFRIGRKRPRVRRNRKNVLRTGIKVKPLPAEDYFGFEVDGDHLFLLADFTVVHNCYTAWLTALKDYRPAMYTGQQTPNQKAESIKRFTSGETKIAILSLRSGAGLDGLQHVCRTVVFGELDWSPGVHSQCIGRVHRDGQTEPVCAYFLHADRGSDPVVLDVLGVKRGQIDGLIDPDAELVEAQIDPDHLKKLAAQFLAQADGKARPKPVASSVSQPVIAAEPAPAPAIPAPTKIAPRRVVAQASLFDEVAS